jgi:exopolysaccharide production protein ExoQ
MRIALKSAENAFLGATAFALSGALLQLLLPGQTALSGNATFRFLLAALYLGVCVVAFRASNRGETLHALQRNPAVLCLLLLSCVSFLWAAMPSFSLQRSIAVTGTSLVGVTLAAQRSLEEQLRLLRRIFRLTALLSLGCMLVAPHIAWTSIGLEGVFNQKNNLGAAMAIAILVDQYLPAESKRARIFKVLWLCLYTALLILSRSATSLVSLGAALVLVQAYQRLRRRMRLPLGVVLLGIGCTLVVAGFLLADDQLLPSLFGRSADLTGRTELWGLVTGVILRRPILGYGYSSFWGGASPGSDDIARQIGWAPEYSHNGYLELVLNLGLIGLLLFVILFGKGIVRAVQAAESREEEFQPIKMWPLACLVFFAVHNTAECTILSQNSLEWVIFLSTVMSADPRLMFAAVESPSHQPDHVSYVPT